jgi:hypothetical protein
MEEELNRLEGDARELQLLEYSRLDFLNHTERKVYLKNKVEVSSPLTHKSSRPISS